MTGAGDDEPGEGAVEVVGVRARDGDVVALVEALTAELALAGYTDEETFGYSLTQLEERGVVLLGVRRDGVLVGIGGLEVQDGATGELKRFFVRPGHRGSGAADAVLDGLVALARERGVRWLRLETGDDQHAAVRFYARHGFAVVDRFGPYVRSARSVCMARDLGTGGAASFTDP